jgi:phage-related protein
MRKFFEVELLEDAQEFIDSLDLTTRKKVYYCIQVAQCTKDPELFKKLAGTDIWEFKVLFRRTKYRLFAFWDIHRNSLVICTHGIIKKTDKTPSKEIEKAVSIRKKYIESHGK